MFGVCILEKIYGKWKIKNYLGCSQHFQEIKIKKCMFANTVGLFSFGYLIQFHYHCSYVQHRISEQNHLLSDQLINRNGLFLVAGNSKNMPMAVKEALSNALDDNYVQTMIKCGRYQEETWA